MEEYLMDLNIVWFILITVLFAGFFLLEGFDYGVGFLSPFITEDAVERRLLLHTIAPVWDGNEVWMITAGGAFQRLLSAALSSPDGAHPARRGN